MAELLPLYLSRVLLSSRGRKPYEKGLYYEPNLAVEFYVGVCNRMGGLLS
jgi:hypothetical protein